MWASTKRDKSKLRKTKKRKRSLNEAQRLKCHKSSHSLHTKGQRNAFSHYKYRGSHQVNVDENSQNQSNLRGINALSTEQNFFSMEKTLPYSKLSTEEQPTQSNPLTNISRNSRIFTTKCIATDFSSIPPEYVNEVVSRNKREHRLRKDVNLVEEGKGSKQESSSISLKSALRGNELKRKGFLSNKYKNETKSFANYPQTFPKKSFATRTFENSKEEIPTNYYLQPQIPGPRRNHSFPISTESIIHSPVNSRYFLRDNSFDRSSGKLKETERREDKQNHSIISALLKGNTPRSHTVVSRLLEIDKSVPRV